MKLRIPNKDPQTYNYTGGEDGDYSNVSNDTDFIENRIKGAKGLALLTGLATGIYNKEKNEALGLRHKHPAKEVARLVGATAGVYGGIHAVGKLAKRYHYSKPEHIEKDQRARNLDATIKARAAKMQAKLDERWASPDDLMEFEKTAGVGKTIYDSKSKLKDAAFGVYKKGPYKGDNKFNVAYGKKRTLNSWKKDVYKNDAKLDGKIEQRHKDAYDDAFVEAAARPVALTALGLGVGIYGGKKLLDRYNKRRAKKKENSYYV